ncbi:MAG TPA: SHOCT domain-containing protein [Candidatus Methylomirabilis sp.]|nr:SHOCT domain-containing protein [Candidatus Methylomirabilis sp.]
MGIVATSYPLLDAFLTMLWIVGFFLWIWLAILVFSDIFRSRDMSGWAKAGWIVVIFILPLIGVLIYLIVRGKKMQQHAEEAAVASDLATREYIRTVVSQTDSSDELSKLTSLHDSGVLSDEEYESMKARLTQSAK